MTSDAQVQCISVTVHGLVQGVGFRQWVRKMASQRNLVGWVRNKPDGRTVEAVVQGPQSALERMTELLSSGPPGSRVEQIEVQWISHQDLPERFEVRR